uniref:Mitochondrial 2-oxoglutarate/malate carrier protein n=1 Tax=Zooxanthella nutricula TaxID=1333877 RepID=A0A7S2J2T0_9DINO
MSACSVAAPSGAWAASKPFVNGGMAASIGISVMNPVDVVKTRLQIAGGGNPLSMARSMIAQQGLSSLYVGLTAQYLRAWTYQTARLGAYRSLTNALQAEPGKNPPLWQKAGAGLAAGAFGAIIGTPAELAIIRMQADTALPAAERRGYRNVGDALVRVVRSEGLSALLTGTGPTILRAMALNCGALASYDQSKEVIDDFVGQKGSKVGIAGASAISGLVGAVFSLPFDYVKMQIQRMQPDASGKLPFDGTLDCVQKTLKEHGPKRFYAGFPTYAMRISPMITLTWLILEGIQAVEAGQGW